MTIKEFCACYLITCRKLGIDMAVMPDNGRLVTPAKALDINTDTIIPALDVSALIDKLSHSGYSFTIEPPIRADIDD